MWLILLICMTLNLVSMRTVDPDLGEFSKKQLPYSVVGSNALARSALIERQEKLQYNCEEIIKMGIDQGRIYEPDDFKNILVDDQHELLYCYVPKVRTLI